MITDDERALYAEYSVRVRMIRQRLIGQNPNTAQYREDLATLAELEGVLRAMDGAVPRWTGSGPCPTRYLLTDEDRAKYADLMAMVALVQDREMTDADRDFVYKAYKTLREIEYKALGRSPEGFKRLPLSLTLGAENMERLSMGAPVVRERNTRESYLLDGTVWIQRVTEFDDGSRDFENEYIKPSL